VLGIEYSNIQLETLDFIAPHLWPPNISDLNPVDYSIKFRDEGRKCQAPSKTQTDGRTDGQRATHAHQQRPPRSPSSHSVDVAATRRPAAKRHVSLCRFVRLLDGV